MIFYLHKVALLHPRLYPFLNTYRKPVGGAKSVISWRQKFDIIAPKEQDLTPKVCAESLESFQPFANRKSPISGLLDVRLGSPCFLIHSLAILAVRSMAEIDFLRVGALAGFILKKARKRRSRRSHRLGIRNVVRLRFDWEHHCEILGEERFNRAYRMKRETFNRLLLSLERHLAPNAQGRVGSSTLGAPRTISSTCKLSMCLRYLAGGSYLDIAPTHSVHSSTFYQCVEEVMRAIDKEFSITFPQNDESSLKEIAAGFSRGGESPLKGCVGAVDGVAVKIKEPSRGSVPNPSAYFNRKGFFSINVQALCDSRYRFLFFSSSCAGSTHDSTALSSTRFSYLFDGRSDSLPSGYYIVGDEAYPCGNKLLAPWPGRNLSVWKDSFNYWLSAARIHIEQAFGILKMRWGILWKPLGLSLEKVSLVVSCCMKLHNFILERVCEGEETTYNLDQNEESLRANHDFYETFCSQDLCDTESHLRRRRRDLERSSVREAITGRIERLRLRRPAH